MGHGTCPNCGEHYTNWVYGLNRPKPCRRCASPLRVFWPAYLFFPVAPTFGMLLMWARHSYELPPAVNLFCMFLAMATFVFAYLGVVFARLVALPSAEHPADSPSGIAPADQ